MDIKEAIGLIGGRSGPHEDDWELLEAAEVLRDAYLAQLHEDDGQLVTSDWVKKICPDYKDGCGVWNCGAGDCVSYLETINGVFVNGRRVCSITTRGQLRALVRGLGGEA